MTVCAIGLLDIMRQHWLKGEHRIFPGSCSSCLVIMSMGVRSFLRGLTCLCPVHVHHGKQVVPVIVEITAEFSLARFWMPIDPLLVSELMYIMSVLVGEQTEVIYLRA